MAFQVFSEGYEDDYWTEETPVDYWPLLDIREALKDCERTLSELTDYVETLVAECDDAYPPDAPHLLRTLAAMRAQLADMLTPALQQAVEAEHAQYEADMARWEGLPALDGAPGQA